LLLLFRPISNQGIVFQPFNGDLEHAFLQIEKHAFAGIEISLASPEEINLNQLERLLNQTKVKISAFSTDAIFEHYDGCLVCEMMRCDPQH